MMRPPETTDHGRNTHDLTGCRCVYLQPIAYVDADVANPRLVVLAKNTNRTQSHEVATAESSVTPE